MQLGHPHGRFSCCDQFWARFAGLDTRGEVGSEIMNYGHLAEYEKIINYGSGQGKQAQRNLFDISSFEQIGCLEQLFRGNSIISNCTLEPENKASGF